MRRTDSEQTAAVGHDSFLDIVTNMVGILIVLVMVVGMRIKNTPAAPAPSEPEAVAECEKELAREQALRNDVLKVAEQLRSIEAETALRDRERALVATALASLERNSADRQNQLAEDAQADANLRQAIANARSTLEQFRQPRPAEETETRPILLESFPTPLAKPVDGPEVHLQLRGGRIAAIPLESLLLLARAEIRSKIHDFENQRDLSETANTVGPRDGFRFRYTVQRHDETVRTPQGLMRREMLRMVRWTLIPVTSQLGETAEEALAEGSKFRQFLSTFRPADQVVTVWVYPDSFDAFREIRKELHRLGFATAARPLPDDSPIAGSVDGTKSVAE